MLESGRRNVEQDDAASELREKPRRPTRARAEFEHRQPRLELQRLQDRGQVRQEPRRLVHAAERFRQMVIPCRERGEVLLGGGVQLLDRRRCDQLLYVDRLVDRSPEGFALPTFSAAGLALRVRRARLQLRRHRRSVNAIMLATSPWSSNVRYVAGQAGGVEDLQHVLDPIRVRRHERLRPRLSAQRVGHAVDARHALAQPARRR